MDRAIFSAGKNNDIHYAVIPENHPFFDQDVANPSLVSICGHVQVFSQYHIGAHTAAELASLTIREVEADGQPIWINHFRSKKPFLPKRSSYQMALRPLPSRSPSDICDEGALFSTDSVIRDYGSRKINARRSSRAGDEALMKASHLLSDAVYFVGNNIDDLLAQYTSWMSECTDRLADEQLAPFLRVILIDQEHGYDKDDLKSRFDVAKDAGARMDVHVFDSTQPISSLAAYDARCGMVRRQHLGQCWSSRALKTLLHASIEHFYGGAASFSFIDALVGGAVVESVDDGFWKDTFRAHGSDGSMPLLAAYIAHSIVGDSRYSSLLDNCISTAAERGASLIDHVIERRYQPWYLKLCSYEQDAEDKARIASTPNYEINSTLKYETKQRIKSYMLGPSPLESHIACLNDHRHKLQTQRLKYACVACFFNAWADLLPCGHGFCHRCSHSLIGRWRQSGVLRFDSCPVCLTYFSNTFCTPASPPTAGGRVLSLDGGGVKVVVLLKVLDQLGGMICPDAEISSFFDLVVGTSAGEWFACTLSLSCWTGAEDEENWLTGVRHRRTRRSCSERETMVG